MLNPVVVFQQIAQAGRAGRVDFESGPTKHQFFLSQGQILYAVSSDPYYSLDAYLLRKQSLSKLDQKFVRTRAQEELKPIEAVIEAQGLIPRTELANVMASLIREIAYDLFSWTEGDYSVSNGEQPPQGALLVDFSVDGLLEKGRQVHDKWRKLSGKVPKLEVVLHRSATSMHPDSVEISPEEWQILAAMDDVRNVYEICFELSPNRLQILSRIARLLEKDLLEIIDFKDRTRPGGLGNKGLKYSTVSAVFRNLFSILYSRLEASGESDGAKKLHQASQTLLAKGHPSPPGLHFDSQQVFDAQVLLNSFGYVGQMGDLRSLLRGLSLVLQQALVDLKSFAPDTFEQTVSDMRSVLGIAEELLPDFHLSLHTAVEKALLGEPVAAALPQPGTATPAPIKASHADVTVAAPAPNYAAAHFNQVEQHPEPKPAPAPSIHYMDTDRTAVVQQPPPSKFEAPTESVDPELVDRALARPSSPEARSPAERSSSAIERSSAALERAALDRSTPLPERAAPSTVKTPVERPVPSQLRQQPPPPPPVEKKEELSPPSKTTRRRAVPQEEVPVAKPEAAPVKSPEESSSVRERPRVKPKTEDIARNRAEQEEEDEGGPSKALIGVLVSLIVLLLATIGVGGYLLSTDKQLRVRLQKLFRSSKPKAAMILPVVAQPRPTSLLLSRPEALPPQTTGTPPWSDV